MKKFIYLPLLLLCFTLGATNPTSVHTPTEGFFENKGQVKQTDGLPAPYVSHLLERGGAKIFLLKQGGIAYQFERLHYPEGYEKLMGEKFPDPEKMKQREELSHQVRLETYRMDVYLEGANPSPRIESVGRSEDYLNYYNHDALDVHHYEKVVFKEVYPHIDWVVYIQGDGMKYDFVVRPGGNPADIRLRFQDQEELYLNQAGELVFGNRMGRFTEQRPVSFQGSHEIATAFVLEGDRLTFRVDGYDKTRELVIDPYQIWGTYYGGSLNDYAVSCKTDASGNVFLAGSTESNSAISAAGGYQISIGGSADAFLVKFNSAGVRQWGTYYGGPGYEGNGYCAINGQGIIFLSGYTYSAGNIAFSGHQNSLNGDADGFLVKFDAAGFRIWSTYYGGTLADYAYTCSTDGLGNAYLAGYTRSTSNIAQGGHQNTLVGTADDAFLVKFNGSGQRQWGTYYGGSSYDYGYFCKPDAQGDVYLYGSATSSDNIAFGGFQNSLIGIRDGFLVKFNASGVRTWATYVRGNSDYFDAGGMDIDAQNNIYVVGRGFSCPNNVCRSDAFMAKYNSSGVQQWQIAYGSASDDDSGADCAIDAQGNLYMAGTTSSVTDIAYNGLVMTAPAENNAFLVKFNASGQRQWATYFGGSGDDYGNACAIDPQGNIYLAGNTNSGALAVTGGHQTTLGGGSDVYLAKFACSDFTASIAGAGRICYGASTTLVASGGTNYAWQGGPSTAAFTISPTAAQTFSVTATNNNGCGSIVHHNVDVTNVVFTNTTSTSCPFQPTGTATVYPSGGQSPYSYLWPNGQTNATGTGLAQGLNSVTVSDAIGCTASSTVSIATSPGPNIATDGVLPTSCNSGNDGGVQITVTPPTQTTQSLNTSLNTLNGSVGGQMFDVSINRTLSITGLALNFNGTSSGTMFFYYKTGSYVGNIGPAQGSWILVATLPVTGAGANNPVTVNLPTALDLAPGNYAFYVGTYSPMAGLRVTVGTGFGNVFAFDNNISITDATARLQGAAGLEFTTSFYNQTPYNFSGSILYRTPTPSTYTYLWNNGASTQDISGLTAGQYTQTATDNFGCAFTSSYTVAEPAPLAVAFNTLNPTCFNINNGQSTASAFGGNSPYSYLWSNGSTGSNLNGVPAGTYSVTVTDNKGCTISASATLVVQDVTPPVIACPGFRTQSGNGTVALGNYIAQATATDDCSLSSVTQSPAPGTLYSSAQVVTVVLTATDAFSNTSTCSFLVSIDVCPSVPGVIYVNDNAPGANNGTSWTNAYTSLQTALTAAAPGTQIWVARGTYRPTTGIGRTETFSLKSGVAVYGGFPDNGTGCTLSLRDWQANPTILSGNIGNPALSNDNSYRVVTALNVGAGAVLDGFHIVDGYSNSNGAGIFVQSSGGGTPSTPNFARLRVADNYATAKGAGTYLYALSGGTAQPVFNEVTFEDNYAFFDGGALCAMAQGGTLQASFTGCVFSQNQTPQKGGAFYHWATTGGTSTLNFSACTFDQNSAGALGGVGYSLSRGGAALTVSATDCEFTANSAPTGGALYQYATGGGVNLLATRCLFSGNTAPGNNGGALSFFAEYSGGNNNATISASTFENDTSAFGGALYAITMRAGLTNLQVSGTRFSNNYASQNGGAAAHFTQHVGSSSTLQFTNCVFSNNLALKSGGAFYINPNNSSPMTTGLQNCTLFGNSAGTGGCAYNIAATATSNLTMRNCIARNNPATDASSRTFVNMGPMANLSFVHNLLDAVPCSTVVIGSGVLTCGAGNLAGSPGFVNAAAGDFHLTASSSAVNAGQAAGAPATDFDGSPRPQGGGVDMGAFEFGGARPQARVAAKDEMHGASVFPNPTTGDFTVTFEQSFTGLAQLFDPQGRMVAAMRINGQTQAEWSSATVLAAGPYLLRLTDEAGQVQTLRVVVQKP